VTFAFLPRNTCDPVWKNTCLAFLLLADIIANISFRKRKHIKNGG